MNKLTIPDNITDIAYQAIKEQILNLNIPPGSRITQDELSRKLGISKTPIREAFNRLETEGLIQILPRKGTQVSTYGIEEVKEICDIREVLEGLAARLASQTLLEEDFIVLETLIKNAHQAALSKDIVEFSRYDSSFHLEMVKKSGSSRLLKVYSNIYDLVQIIRLQYLHLPQDSQRLYLEHLNIILALRSRDPDKSESAVRSHLQRVNDNLIATAKSFDTS